MTIEQSQSLYIAQPVAFFFFFFNDTATTEIYPLSLHDALPILLGTPRRAVVGWDATRLAMITAVLDTRRSEEHTSELQSQSNLVCRLLLEKKNRHASRLNDVCCQYF